MCGIFACLLCEGGSHPSAQLKAEILTKLKRRGPDVIRELTVAALAPSLRLNLIGSLLRMRGSSTPQPHPVQVAASDTNYLLWNGNIFGGGITVPPGGNDTVALANELSSQEEVSGLLSTLSAVHGPWAFVYWQESTRSLWFGRDVFGRRSLLWHTPSCEDEAFILCSVGQYSQEEMPLGYWQEVPANGVYQLKICGSKIESGELICYPWMQGDEHFQSVSSIQEDMSSLQCSFTMHTVINKCLQVPFPPLNKHTPAALTFVATERQTELKCPVAASTSDQCKYSITSCSDQLLAEDSTVGSRNDNTATEGACPRSDVNKADLTTDNVPSHTPSVLKSATESLFPSPDWSVLSQQFLSVLQEAVQVRVQHAPDIPLSKSVSEQTVPCEVGPQGVDSSSDCCRHYDVSSSSECETSQPKELSCSTAMSDHVEETSTQGTCSDVVKSKTSRIGNPGKVPAVTLSNASPVEAIEDSSKHFHSDTDIACEGRAKVAVLYSGGVDSTVLAALADRCLEAGEEIDLINVAFEQRTAAPDKRYEVPDRMSAIDSLKELNPQRQWNLVLVNVTVDEVNTLRRSRVSHMIYPLCTVLDDSIGCSLWFAARGEGVLYDEHHNQTIRYRSQARTLFIGIGADEQLAGYSRHRTKFNSLGWDGLNSELEMDIKRLARRNLGRDDRCVADHHREGQYPFLDENVVSFLQTLPIYHKADLSLPRGQGEKRLLREVAGVLGCHRASQLPKRAIQFGSRMAKMAGTCNSREQGSNVTDRLLPGSS